MAVVLPALLVGVGAWMVTARALHHPQEVLASPGGPGASASPSVVPSSPAPSPATVAFATVRGLTLYVPALHVVTLGYHEASYPVALAMTPLGRCVHDYNRYKFTKPPPTAGPDFIVMSSRGRPHPATSAVDVAMRAGTVILSPVTGRVASVRHYLLYGRTPDIRLAIWPEGRTKIQVVMEHLTDLRVRRGQQLFAGVTPIATPRILPFSSQVNDYIGAGIPHIHVEVNTYGHPPQ
jgi:hypothetical protein